MFDCGEYSYAVSNLMHMMSGDLKIVRIDQKLETVVLFDTINEKGWTSLEYQGRFENEKGHVLIASGCTRSSRNHPEIEYRDRTILFQIDINGNCSKGFT